MSDEITSAALQRLLGVNKVTLHEIEAKGIMVCGESLVRLSATDSTQVWRSFRGSGSVWCDAG